MIPLGQRFVEIIDPETGEIPYLLEPDRNSCHARAMGEYCGGCDSCLIAQLAHSGALQARYLPEPKAFRLLSWDRFDSKA